MQNRQRTWSFFATAVSFFVGIIFLLNDSAAGWFFIIMGMIYLRGSTGAGQAWAASNPSLGRRGLIGGILLLLLLVVVSGAVFQLK